MPCDYPVRCQYLSEDGHCTFDWDAWDERGEHPCSRHQRRIDLRAMREVRSAIEAGAIDEARAILNSPFVSFSPK